MVASATDLNRRVRTRTHGDVAGSAAPMPIKRACGNLTARSCAYSLRELKKPTSRQCPGSAAMWADRLRAEPLATVSPGLLGVPQPRKGKKGCLAAAPRFDWYFDLRRTME